MFSFILYSQTLFRLAWKWVRKSVAYIWTSSSRYKAKIDVQKRPFRRLSKLSSLFSAPRGSRLPQAIALRYFYAYWWKAPFPYFKIYHIFLILRFRNYFIVKNWRESWEAERFARMRKPQEKKWRKFTLRFLFLKINIGLIRVKKFFEILLLYIYLAGG